LIFLHEKLSQRLARLWQM